MLLIDAELREESMAYPHLPEVDLHTHTIASGHAFSTITEMASVAAARGLRGLGTTDHGPALPGGPHPYHFHALRFIPPHLRGVRIFRGVEANIIGPGELDLPEHTLSRLDLIMAGFHEDCGFRGHDSAENTEALIQLMTKHHLHVLTHLGNPVFPIDGLVVAQRAAELGVAIEINNASFSISRKGSADNCRQMACYCAQFGTPVAINSDAHIADTVGEFEQALQAAEESGVRWEQIVNRTLESTLAFLGLDTDSPS